MISPACRPPRCWGSPVKRPELAGKTVLIGRTDSETDDLWRTAIAPDLPGLGLLAESVYTIRSLDRPLREDWSTRMLTILLALPFLLLQALFGPNKLRWLGLLVVGTIGVACGDVPVAEIQESGWT